MAVSKRIQQAQRKVRLLTIAAGATLLLGLGSLFFPWQAIQAQQAQLQEKLQALQTAQHATSQLRIALQQLQLTQQELRFLERGVSEAAYVPTMLKQFEQTARQHQLQIVAIRPQQPQTNPSQNDKSAKNNQPYEEQLFEIQLRGKFWGLMSLLKSLESFPKILSVQTLYAQAKSGSEQAPENPDLEIRMVVKAFIFRADQTPAPSKT